MTEVLRLLLVEDSPTDAGLIQANLRLGLGNVDVDRVDRLSTAIQAIANQHFSAVLLDLNLPDSSGVETFRQLSASSNGTPIVVLSGMDDNKTAIEAVGAGAADYVQKNHYDAHTLARSVRFAIERTTFKATERELISIRSELTAAQKVQDSLYPVAAPVIDGFDIAAGIRSAGIGCGDYYDFIPLDDGRFIFVVGDVSGHGMGSAMVMAETRACLRTLTDVEITPQAMLPAMNRLVFATTSEEMFVTLVLIVFDPVAGSFEYYNAGHPGWLLQKDVRRHLVTHQIPLGLLPDVDHSVSDSFTLESGDILVIPTDGIAESPLGNAVFGNDKMLDCVEANQYLPASEIVDILFNAAVEFTDSKILADDMTVMILKAE